VDATGAGTGAEGPEPGVRRARGPRRVAVDFLLPFSRAKLAFFRPMTTTAAIFSILTLILLGVGWYSVNRREPPPRRRQAGDGR
jgi:hypothetical protein